MWRQISFSAGAACVGKRRAVPGLLSYLHTYGLIPYRHPHRFQLSKRCVEVDDEMISVGNQSNHTYTHTHTHRERDLTSHHKHLSLPRRLQQAVTQAHIRPGGAGRAGQSRRGEGGGQLGAVGRQHLLARIWLPAVDLDLAARPPRVLPETAAACSVHQPGHHRRQCARVGVQDQLREVVLLEEVANSVQSDYCCAIAPVKTIKEKEQLRWAAERVLMGYALHGTDDTHMGECWLSSCGVCRVGAAGGRTVRRPTTGSSPRTTIAALHPRGQGKEGRQEE